MTGPWHYAEAERLLEEFGQEVDVPEDEVAIVMAQLQGGTLRALAHATLALAAATADSFTLPGAAGDAKYDDWREVMKP